MVNISAIIGNLKAKARDRETKKTQAVAMSLADLKKERVRVEGQAKIYSTYERESAKLNKAKETLRKAKYDAGIGKSINAIKNFKSETKPILLGSGSSPLMDSSNRQHPIFGDSGKKKHPIFGD